MMKGMIVRLHEKLVVVPYEESNMGWFCIVVKSSSTAYPVGGYNIFVFEDDLLAGEVVELL